MRSRPRLRPRHPEQGLQARVQVRRGPPLTLGPAARESLDETLAVEGLQQVVERADFKCANGELIECGHEYYRRR